MKVLQSPAMSELLVPEAELLVAGLDLGRVGHDLGESFELHLQLPP
jgi:hypothetical protein